MKLSIEDRAREGIFIGFQYPVEIPGVSMTNFMRTAVNESEEIPRDWILLPAVEFLKLMESKINDLSRFSRT
jgi:Fe-S cluster assembly ATP-binding protein